MNIAIIGAGALGSLFGGVLSIHGHDVWLYNPSNTKHIEAIQRRGLMIQTAHESLTARPHATARLDEIAEPVELLGIFVKAYHTEIAIKEAHPLVGRETWTLSLQNGIGPEEILAQHVQNGRLLRGVTAQGATLMEPGVVKWGGQGPTHLGLFGHSDFAHNPQIEELCRLFSTASWETHRTQNIKTHLWEKLLINAAINPVTALFDVLNGQLVSDQELRLIVTGIIKEALPICRAHGIQLTEKQAVERVEAVCRATAQNLSSMLQDIKRSKRTEIEFINGVIVSEARRLNLEAPLHHLLTRLLMRSKN